MTAPGQSPPGIPDHELLRCIGRGSYGEVWLARNIFGEYRAVKILCRRDFDQDRPFDREFEGIRRFEPISRSHPSQLAILHAGRDDVAGCFYYVMELADAAPTASGAPAEAGETRPPFVPASVGPPPTVLDPTNYTPRTLRSELEQRSRLPARECLDIALALTTALEHLHSHDLVHRDIKPSNILFVGGVPKLADIGLVTAVGDARSIVGTEGYLPADGPGTPQADLFSLGKVLYEISTGLDRRQFPELPAELRSFEQFQLVLELNEIVLKACARDPARRYRSAHEMHAELSLLVQGRSVRSRRQLQTVARVAQRAIPAAVAVGLLALVLGRAFQSPPPTPQAAAPVSVFVLPFRFPGIGLVLERDVRPRITDAFIDGLGVLTNQGIAVGPRKSGWVHLNETERRRHVSAELGYDYVLTGLCTTNQGLLDLSVSLYAGTNDVPLWTDVASFPTNRLIETERRVLTRIATTLGVEVTPAQDRIDVLLTNNLHAFHLLQQGFVEGELGTADGRARMMACYNQARGVDPNYLWAHGFVMQVDRDSALDEVDPRRGWALVKATAQAMLRIDDTSMFAKANFWTAKLVHEWDWSVTNQLDELRRLKPEDHPAWVLYLTVLGRHEETIRELEPDGPLDPEQYGPGVEGAAMVYCGEGRYERAMELARRAVKAAPNNCWAHQALARVALGLKDYPQAIAALDRALELYGTSSFRAMLGQAHALNGDTAVAAGILRQLRELERDRYVQPYFFAWLEAALGNRDGALHELERACEQGSEFLVAPYVGGLLTDPAWDDLREEPRFQELLRRTGLDVWPK